MSQVRVRFAPSPTGYLHIGGARTALFNWFFARQQHGKFILRIEDTDTQRLKEDSVAQILASLKWLGINWDEGPESGGACGPYFQSERLELYKREALRLVEEGRAYYCFCTPEELGAAREQQRKNGEVLRYTGHCRAISREIALQRIAAGEKAVIRLRVPDDGTVTVPDMIHGEVTFRLDQLDDLIIMKSNGIPAYNFACVVDDHAMELTHVVRAEEHLSNTPKQVLLYRALGYPAVQFAHLPMILAPDHTKLSKRHGATSVEEFREQGFLAPAIVNYLTFLGWSSGDGPEIITPAASAAKFSFDKVSKKAAIYDTKKLAWLNAQYLTSLSLEEVTQAALPFLRQAGILGEAEAPTDLVKAAIDLVRQRVKTLVELTDGIAYFFKEVTEYDAKGLAKHFAKPEAAAVLRQGRACLEKVECFDALHTEAAYRQLLEELGIKGGELMHPTRLALTGRMVSPGLFEVMELLGKERCLARMEQAAAFIAAQKV